MTFLEQTITSTQIETQESESLKVSVKAFQTSFTNFANQPSEAFKYMISNRSEVYRWEGFLEERKQLLLGQLQNCSPEDITQIFKDALKECSDNLAIGKVQRENNLSLEVRWKLPPYYASYEDESIHIGFVFLKIS